MYLGTDDGVVVLAHKDGGDWEVRSQALRGWAVPAVAVSPARPHRVVAGTRGDGVWVSEDLGQTWKKPSYGKRGPGKVRCITVHPEDPDTLYVGAEPIDIFVSHDAGKSWTALESVRELPWVASVEYPVATVEPHVRDIALDPSDPSTIYAALQVGFMLKSTDGGGSWKLLDRGLDADVHTLALDPVNPARMFIATGGDSSRSGLVKGRALYMSDDAGETWRPTAMEFPQEYSVPLAVHPRDRGVVYSAVALGNPGQWRRPSGAESALIRTRDGGKRWEKLQKGLEKASTGFPEVIAFDEGDPDRLYLGLRSGELYASQDGGDSWAGLGVKVSSVSDLKCVQA
jgi:photosystem II stability/assembly factor-like uncharacterized protein